MADWSGRTVVCDGVLTVTPLAEIAPLKERVAELEAQPKPFVSPPATFDIAELSDAVEIGGKIYVTYDALMENISRYDRAVRKLAEAERQRDAARAEALEDAAKVADAEAQNRDHFGYPQDAALMRMITSDIRSLIKEDRK